MIRRTFTKLVGSAIIAATLPGQERIPFLSRERLDALRDRRIRHIVAYAARYVPYYRDLFAREGIDPRVRTAADLDRLPLLEKDLVRSRPELFIAQTPAGRRALSFLTSGSTGSPMRVDHDRRSLLENIAYGERERATYIAACGTFRPRELYIGNETSVMRQVSAFYQANTMLPIRPRRRFLSVLEPVERIAEIANSERPDILVGYGGWVDLFFKTVAARGIKLHLPKLVVYMAEALPHGAREFIEKNFSIAVMSRYSAAEAFKIGYFCERRTGFHIHEDLCHIRVLRPDGQPAGPGEAGEIVLTNLVNRATVLINYRIGDVGALVAEACPCGRTLKLLSELEGRVEDILPLPGGRFVHPRAFWEVFKHDPNVLQYQLTQHELQRFELGLVTVDEPAFRAALELARPELERILGADAVIDASRRTEFDRGGGKFRAVASRCGRRGN